MKSITTVKGWLGGLFLLNLDTIFTLLGKSYNTTPTRYVTIVNLILAVVCVYFAFKLDSLVKTSFNFVHYTIWFGLVYTIISELATVLNIPWTVLYIAVSAVILYYLHKAKKDLAIINPAPTPIPPAPTV
jgi:uncharacterized membrane protein